MTTTETTVACTECEAPVRIEADALAGEILACGSCGAELELVQLTPARLQLAPEVEEDWGE